MAENQDKTITNKHGDHIASCLCCKNLDGDMGSHGYSDIFLHSPGYPGYIVCNVGEFSFEQGDFSEILRVIHNTARHCKLFVPRKCK